MNACSHLCGSGILYHIGNHFLLSACIWGKTQILQPLFWLHSIHLHNSQALAKTVMSPRSKRERDMWYAWNRKRSIPSQKILIRSSKEAQCNSCHLSVCKVLLVWVFVLTREGFVFKFVGLSVKLLISVGSVICKKSKPLLICLGQHYFFTSMLWPPNLPF